MHILHGSNPFAVYPRVIDHEFAGTVTALGRHVTGVAVGDRVVVDPVVSCGHCYPCRIGRSNVSANLEVIGVHRDGGFRNFVAVPAHNAIPIPADMPFSLAALAEPISIAANVLTIDKRPVSHTPCSGWCVATALASTRFLLKFRLAWRQMAQFLVGEPQ
ncbi:alcohol dehydrogenase catalytic domain-containing protein [Mesorhizobium sp. M0460]|uniref:alcohol dehydrogenase catalytic domain-containing protein n=1 Tax=unclassified Mesorhizobium TaxID=325217 RepID=UPI003335658F